MQAVLPVQPSLYQSPPQQWQNGNQHGKGTTWLQTGANVTQSFDNNKPQNGDCRYEFFDGRVYEGEWEGTKMKAGRALMTYPDSMGVFQGQFRCTKPRDYPSSDLDLTREGKGKLTRPEGITLEGDWKKDSWVEGVWVKSESTQSSTWQGGRVVHGNGDLYFGHLKESRKKHGEGEMKFVSGRVYRGQWADDRMDGKGKSIMYQSHGGFQPTHSHSLCFPPANRHHD